MKKSMLARILTALLCVLLLCGCSSQSDDGADKKNDQSGGGTQQEQTDSNTADESGAGDAGDAGQAAGETYTYDHMTITLPEGFTVDESGSFPMMYCPEYPEKTDNINMTKAEGDDISNYSQELFETYYSQMIQGFEGITSYEELKVDGLDAIKCTYQVTMSGIEMHGTQYYVFGSDYTDIITFTSTSGDYDAAFEACAASISMD